MTWFLALWFGAHLLIAGDDIDAAHYAARQARAEADATGIELDAAYRAVAKLQERCTEIARERPMTFRDVPFYHAAHVHTVPRGMYITWDN